VSLQKNGSENNQLVQLRTASCLQGHLELLKCGISVVLATNIRHGSADEGWLHCSRTHYPSDCGTTPHILLQSFSL